jgi:hypothetical protein
LGVKIRATVVAIEREEEKRKMIFFCINTNDVHSDFF